MRERAAADRPLDAATAWWKPFPLACNPHPRSGYHYIHVIGSPMAFLDEYAAYRAEAERTPWMSFVCRDHWNEIVRHPAWTAGGNFWILWNAAAYQVTPPDQRRSKIGLYYGESMGTPEDLEDKQVLYNKHFQRNWASFDMTWGDTPSSIGFIRRWTPNADFAPVGYDPETLGVPDWQAQKKWDVGVYGSMVGRRLKILPELKRHFGERMLDLSGTWGIERSKALNECRATLFIAHSSHISGSTLRIWQAAATSAALIKEADDSWPAEAGKDYLEIPRFDETSPLTVIEAIEGHLKGDLLAVAKTMHEDMAPWTIRRILEEFYVPSSMKVQR